MTKALNRKVGGLERVPTFDELVRTEGSDISDIGLYTRQPATSFRNFFFGNQADGIQLDDTLDDKVSKILAVLQAGVEVEKQKTLDRQENNRQLFRGHLPNANNEPELGTGSIPTPDNASRAHSSFDGSPPPLPPPLPPPGGPMGPVQGLPLPPNPSFFNGPRREAREQVERGRSPPSPTPGEGGRPPLPQPQRPGSAPPAPPPAAIRDGAAVPVAAVRVPSSSGSASTRSGGNRSSVAPSTSRGSSSNVSVPAEQLAARGRAIARQRGGASAPPMRGGSVPPMRRGNRTRRRRIDTPEPPMYRPYGG